MDEISLLQRVRTDVAERTPEDVARGRAALFEQMESGSPFVQTTEPRRHRRSSWVALTFLAASALTIALVATNVVGLAGWRGGAEAAAADVLESAALAAAQTTDPVVGPGQYLLVQTDAIYGAGSVDDGGSQVVWLESYRHELYVPANRDDDWVWVRHDGEVYQTFGASSEEMASNDAGARAGELLRAPGGTFYGGSPTMISGDYDSLPRDPHRLLNVIYLKTLTAGRSRDGEALVWIADVLRTGTVPSDLRAALYEAAAEIPGVTITEEQATLDGTTGTAIGRVETVDNTRLDIVIDPVTGQFIGEREVDLDAFGGAPAGTITASTSVRTSVVDSAPEGGTPSGRH